MSSNTFTVEFASDRHPSLVVRDLGVTFVNGTAQVSADLVAPLAGLGHLGVRQVGDLPVDEPVRPRTPRTRKA